jgi:hypothetical protein
MISRFKLTQTLWVQHGVSFKLSEPICGLQHARRLISLSLIWDRVDLNQVVDLQWNTIASYVGFDGCYLFCIEES